MVTSTRKLASRAKVIGARVESAKERVHRCHIVGAKEVKRACVKLNRFHQEPDESFDSNFE
jgi:hypothetical protein